METFLNSKVVLITIALGSWTILSAIMYVAEIVLGPSYGIINIVSHPPLPKLNEFSNGLVSQRCLQCICDLESDCRAVGCAMDQGTDSCGYFQIKECYWNDCGRPGESLEWCSKDKYCSTLCIQRYMNHYINMTECPHTCNSYARMHNGGPLGCMENSTFGYWNKIEQRGCTDQS